MKDLEMKDLGMEDMEVRRIWQVDDTWKSCLNNFHFVFYKSHY